MAINTFRIIFLSFVVCTCFSVVTSVTQAQWSHVKGPFGGCVNAFAASGDHIYAGTNAGLFHSTDDGLSWSTVEDADRYENIQALCAVGSILMKVVANDSSYRSTDFGITWAPMSNLVEGNQIVALKVIGTEIFAGTSGHSGLLVSLDSGATWQSADDNMPYGWISQQGAANVTCMTTDGNRLYIGSTSSNGYGGGIYCTSDLGQHWAVINRGLSDSLGISAIGAHGALLLGAAGAKLYRSVDTGANWMRYDTSNAFGNISLISFIGSTIYLGTNSGAFISIDSGLTWVQQPGLISSDELQAFLVHDTTLLAGMSSAGVLRVSPHDSVWSISNNGIDDASIIAVHSSGGNILVAPGFGLSVSTSSGSSWIQAEGLGNDVVTRLAEDGSFVYAGAASGAIYRSRDHGLTWQDLHAGLPMGARVSAMMAFGGQVFAGTGYTSGKDYVGQLYVSRDSGLTWGTLGSGIQNLPISSLAHLGSNLFVTTEYTGSYRSLDNGYNWTSDTNGLSTPYLMSSTTVGNLLIVGSEGDGAFISTDEGAHWTPRSSGLLSKDGSSVMSLVTSHSTIFAGTFGTPFYSNDTGASWHNLDAGLPPMADAFALATTDDALYAGTFRFGLWKYPLAAVSVHTEPETTHSLQNFPNPFSRSTSIVFTLNERQQVDLEVFDVLGRKVGTLFNGELNAGSHSFKFDGEGLAAGIYTVQLNSTEARTQSRLILSR